MKKIATCIAVAAALAAAAALPAGTAIAANAASDPYTVEGGRLTYTFDDPAQLDDFDLYSQVLGNDMYVFEGKLMTCVFGEQKIILKDKQFNDVDVNVDIECINTHGKFGSGIYVGASNPTDALDGITAWQVAIERDADKDYYNLKLHRFENGVWRGAYAHEDKIPIYQDCIHLRVVVKSNTLYAFVDGELQLTYAVGSAQGMVGLRNFWSPDRYDNFTVTGSELPVDTSEMDALAEEAREKVKENLAEDSSSALNAALALADAATTQGETDAAAEALKKALEEAVTAHTAAELSALLEEARALQNPDDAVYTANSWAALQNVIELAAEKTEADEYELSYWYLRLEARIKNLIKYNGRAQ